MAKTRTISTFKPLPGQTVGRATNLLVDDKNRRVNIKKIEGYCYGAAGTQYFLLFFAATTVPADAQVPLRSLQILGTDGFTFGYVQGLWPDDLQSPPNTGNLIICLSTTEDTLTTITGAGNNMDISVDIEEYELQLLGETVVGDTSTAVQTLQVVADASGPAALVSAICKNVTGGATQYLQLFAKDAAPTTGAVPLLSLACAAGATITPNWGGAYVPHSEDANGTLHNGISFFVSSTAGTYTAVAGTPWTIRVIYKTI